MPLEIERKFLIKELPDNLEKYTKYEIVQGYLLISEDLEIRLRKKGDNYYQTVKSGKGFIREETEIELSSNQFELLWPLTESKRLEKERYVIKYKKHLLELDVYKGDLKNLATVEVEFMTETESNEFVAPAWFGSEITGNDRYKNKNLALFGTPY